MPSTFSTSNRIEKQAPGENENTWSERLNDNVIEMIDESLDGVLSFTLSGSKTLTTADAETDEARHRALNITSGTGGTITIPNVQKMYVVRNGATGSVTVTTGSGTTAAIPAGAQATVISTGSNQVYAGIYADADGDFGSTTVTAGGFLATGTAGVGYTTGAGATETQSTSKSTGVTMNARCGTITMNNAALDGGDSIAFILTNSTIGTADNVTATIQDGINNLRYSVRVGAINAAGGDCAIVLKNETVSSHSDAVKVRVTVHAGSNS